MRRAELVTAVLMVAFSIYLMLKSAELPVGWIKGEGPGGGAFPFWLAAIMLISSIWVIVKWVRGTSPQSQSTDVFMDAYAIKMFCLAGGGLTVMIGLVHIVGMYGAVPIFMLYYLRFLGRHSWRTTLAVSLGTPVVAFFFFDITLRIILPKGYLEPLFIPLYKFFL